MDPISTINQLDITYLQAIQSIANPALTQLMLFITFLGNPIFFILVVAFAYWTGEENRAFFLMNLIVFSAAVAGLLKFAVARPRPSAGFFQVLATDSYLSHSFPSGHATMIAAAFSYSCSFIKKNLRILFVLVVAAVAFSRLYLGMHFPSDVTAGILLGLVIGKANFVARNRLFHRNFRPSKLEDEAALIALLAVAVLGLVFLQQVPLAAALIGFYIGFFLFKEMDLKQTKLTGKSIALKQGAGFAFLVGVFIATKDFWVGNMHVTSAEQFLLYLIGGFWISWAYPVLVERLLGLKKTID